MILPTYTSEEEKKRIQQAKDATRIPDQRTEPVQQNIAAPTAITAASEAKAAQGFLPGYIGGYADRYAKQQADTQKQAEEANQKYDSLYEKYQDGMRNPLADIVLREQRPTRNVDEETRIRNMAKLQALNNMFSLVGKGIAASGGIRPAPVDNAPIYDAQDQLRRLDDIYLQQGQRYDQNTLLSALRKDEGEQALTQFGMNKAQAEEQLARKAGYDAYEQYNKAAEAERKQQYDAGIEQAKLQKDMFVAGLNADSREKVARIGSGATIQAATIRSGSGGSGKKKYIINPYTNEPEELTPELEARLNSTIAGNLDLTKDTSATDGSGRLPARTWDDIAYKEMLDKDREAQQVEGRAKQKAKYDAAYRVSDAIRKRGADPNAPKTIRGVREARELFIWANVDPSMFTDSEIANILRGNGLILEQE